MNRTSVCLNFETKEIRDQVEEIYKKINNEIVPGYAPILDYLAKQYLMTKACNELLDEEKKL